MPWVLIVSSTDRAPLQMSLPLPPLVPLLRPQAVVRPLQAPRPRVRTRR